MLRSSRTPSRVSPARVSLLYSSNSYAGLGGGSGSDDCPDISLQDASYSDREVCHSALWLQGSDVFLYVPYSVFVVVAVRVPSAGAVAAGGAAEVSTMLGIFAAWCIGLADASDCCTSCNSSFLTAHFQLHVRAVLDDEGEDDELLPVAPWV